MSRATNKNFWDSGEIYKGQGDVTLTVDPVLQIDETFLTQSGHPGKYLVFI